jgi:hypothetical protein
MKLWIDCEFNEFGGDLISMALVADCELTMRIAKEEFDETKNKMIAMINSIKLPRSY